MGDFGTLWANWVRITRSTPNDVEGAPYSAANACASRPRRESPAEDLLTCASDSAKPALEPDVFHTAGIALADPDLPEVPSITSVEERQGGPGATFTLGGPRDGGTQYAQRTGETVSGMKTTAGDDKWAIKVELCAAVPWWFCVQT
ncbi:hypothetical protein DPMN_019919 [Dreissena polymorpha]|uniref:Uncharacterized protein n=1 Tax=Dreissena polymorpha TaxID=45954 RepID=A0A9D4S7R6_DREPO|nr:hypothetical protein DPMN_019919 [Dreissena polymorpha]